ncbi:MAG: hypothetical protein IPJ66_15540 [Bacteroidetes bacterium]|nr:hypothetical protein [Bacteroidota bacterium]MBL0137959.1 hypothetical protein [Bacteroidota bacterium]
MMKMNINWKKAGKVSTWVLVLIAFAVTVGFTESKQANLLCTDVRIVVEDSTGFAFVETSDIQNILHDKFGELKGQPVSSINIALLEKIINNNPFISRAEVFSTVDGKLNIEVKQRLPVVRIMNFNNESFYIDDKGVFMPRSEKYTARVPVANGYIFDKEVERSVRVIDEDPVDTSVHLSRIEKVFRVADYIHHHDFWNAQIEQIYVNANGDLELIPRVGDHSIVLGDDQHIEEKFEKLFLFYTEGLNKTGWNKYKVINLKYKDQVVCTKK